MNPLIRFINIIVKLPTAELIELAGEAAIKTLIQHLRKYSLYYLSIPALLVFIQLVLYLKQQGQITESLAIFTIGISIIGYTIIPTLLVTNRIFAKITGRHFFDRFPK